MEADILVVDDQPGIRLLLKDLLTNEGHRVLTAKTGKEALDLIYSHSFDLIFIDYKLPGLDGFNVLKKLEGKNRNIPAILMSGMVLPGEETMQLKNVIAVIAKPFNVYNIVEIVRSATR
ncbi:response regulator [Lentibacillus sediminis]|uniref:response regulator n=1 Tax=Lentibacillus sediminis TaxID=1940529 RepID=UPI000C1C4519|nr:response regulator [Lentibacillus sediminis]